MFSDTLEFVESPPIEFQRYLENVRILEPLGKSSLAVVDSTNTVYIYRLEDSSDNSKILSEGKVFSSPKCVRYGSPNDKVMCLKQVNEDLMAIAYEASDVMLVSWNKQGMPIDVIPYTPNVYQIVPFRTDYLLLAYEQANGDSVTQLYHIPSQKIKILGLNGTSKITSLYTDGVEKAYILLENGCAVVMNIVSNKTLFIAEGKPLIRMVTIQDKYILAHSMTRIYIYDIVEKELIKECDIAKYYKSPIQDMIVIGTKVYMLYNDKVIVYRISSAIGLGYQGEIDIGNVCPGQQRKRYFRKIRQIEGHFVFSIAVYDLEDEYLNDVIVKMELEQDTSEADNHKKRNRFRSSSSRRVCMLEEAERKHIKLMGCYSVETGCFVTEDNVVTHFSLKQGKIMNKVQLDEGIALQDLHFLDQDRILFKYRNKNGQQLFDIFMLSEMKLGSKCSEYCISQGLQVPSFFILLRNGRILADAQYNNMRGGPFSKKGKATKNIDPDQSSTNEDNNLSFSECSNTIWSQNTQSLDDGKKTLGFHERRMNSEGEGPFFSDRSPIKYSINDSFTLQTKKKEMSMTASWNRLNSKTTFSEEVEIRALVEQIPEYKRPSSIDKTKSLCVFNIHSGVSCVNIMDTSRLDLIEAYELGWPRYIGLKKETNLKALDIYDLEARVMFSTVEFVNEIGDVLSVGGTQAAIVTKNEEGVGELVVIFDWLSKSAVLVVECSNVTALLRVVGGHLFWIDQTHDEHVIGGIKLELREDSELEESEELPLYSGKAFLYDKCIEKKKLAFVGRKRTSGFVYYDEVSCPENLTSIKIKTAKNERLSVLHSVLRPVYHKKVIRDVYRMLSSMTKTEEEE